METATSRTGGRERLLDVALRLFLEAGYDGVSMQRIADAARLTKGAPYHHFASKEDLCAQALRRHMAGLHAGLQAAVAREPDLRGALTAVFAHLLGNTDSGMAALVQDFRRHVGTARMAELGITLDPLREFCRGIFREAVRRGEPLRCTPEQAADLFVAVQLGTMNMRRVDPAAAYTPEEIDALAGSTVDLLLHGLLAADAAPAAR